MDIKEFDKWYDEQIKETRMRLPHPDSCDLPVISFPIIAPNLDFFSMDKRLPKDNVNFWTIKYKKVRNKENKIEWQRV